MESCSSLSFSDGARVASSTGIDILLLDDFKLSINDKIYDVRTPKRGSVSLTNVARLSSVILWYFYWYGMFISLHVFLMF